MGQWVVINPVLRENIPYSLEVEIDGGRVVNARCGAAAYWGLDAVLSGKHPFDALQVAQRTHVYAGVAHAVAVAEALEGLLEIAPPANGRLLRNILQGLEFIHAHTHHFYHLALPDFINIDGPPVLGEKLPPAAGKVLREHYWRSFEVLAGIHKMMAVFGGKMPFVTGIAPGGVGVRPDYQKIFALHAQWKSVIKFIRESYLPDVEILSNCYPEYGGIGAGVRRLLSMGAFPLRDGKDRRQRFLPAGVLPGGGVAPEAQNITVDTAYARFKDVSGEPGQPPEPELKSQAYSWLPALRYKGQAYETGAPARMMLAGEGQTARLGAAVYSVMGRHLARGYESLWIAEIMEEWVNGLHPQKPAMAGKFKAPETGEGWAAGESPAGSIVHRFRLQDGRIEFYRMFGSAHWNLGSRDGGGNKGPLEEALTGTPVADPQQPVEVLRVFRAFS